MKKIFILFTVLTISFSFNTFAAPDKEAFKKAFSTPITYADINMEINVEAKDPSDEVKAFLNLKENSSTIYDISIKTTEDLSLIDASAKYKMEFENAPELNTYETEHYFDIDFSGNRPIFINVIKFPDKNQYLYYNIADIPELQPYVYELKEKILSGKYLLNTFDYNEKAQIKNGIYILTLNDDEIKEALKDISLDITPLLSSSMNYTGSNIGKTYNESYPYIKDIQLFGEKGFKAEISLDSENNLDKLNAEINIDANLYELLTKLNYDASSYGLYKNNSQLKAKISIKIDFNNINSDLSIKFPALSTYNTYNIANELVQQHFINTIELSKVNIYTNNSKVYFEDAEPIIENDRTLVPLRKFLNTIGVNDEDIVYEDGYITINYKNQKTVHLNVFDTNASITENGNTTPITLDVSAKMVNDRTLVPLRFLSETFDCQVIFQELNETTAFINVVQNY